jgi:hypothetical protein
LTREFVRSTNDRCLGNTIVDDQSGFDFGSTDSMTGDVDHVVDSTLDPVVTFIVSRDSVTVVEVSGVRLEVGFDVTSVIAVDGSSQRRPRLLADNNTFNVVSFQELASSGVQQANIVTQEGEGCRSRLGSGRTGDRSNADGTGLGHPVRVDDGALSSSDIVVVPVPCFRVDGFTYTADDTQAGKVVLLDIVFTQSSQQSNSLSRTFSIR